MGLYTNRNSHSDFIRGAIEELARVVPGNIYIATAFFTDHELLERLTDRGHSIRLVVRLGFPTSARALQALIENQDVEIRFFTSRSFHPKLYLFGTRCALVGSANFTNSALISNQEIMLEVHETDTRLVELQVLFGEYWAQSRVLTQEVLTKFSELSDKHAQIWRQEEKLQENIKDAIGDVAGTNIERGIRADTGENLFVEDFRKVYQETVRAFNAIQEVYRRVAIRKVTEEELPLRLEIDSFISFVRESHVPNEQWRQTPLLSGEAQIARISALVTEWNGSSWKYLENDIVKDSYPRLKRVFGSIESIRNTTDSDLFDALTGVHSFRERSRFFEGGMPAWKSAFTQANEPTKTRDSLSYLIYGPDSIEVRMANLIYNSKYKLKEFGRANVQELVGWMNKEGLPVINGRTTKILRYFGFDVRQLS